MSHKSKKARTGLKHLQDLTGKSTKSDASTRSAKSGAHITRISATHHSEDQTETKNSPAKLNATISAPAPEKPAESEKSAKTPKTDQKSQKSQTSGEKAKKPFVLFRPFIALGRYLRDAWRELRQVRWPNRRATWKMTLAVLVYCAIFFVFITLLDTLFTFLFQTALK